MSTIGRPRVAAAYVWLTFSVAGIVLVQGFLFGAFYSGSGKDYIDLHRMLGLSSGFATIALVVVAFSARFPRELRVGWWALGWAILWNVQAHVFGMGMKDVRWFGMIHIPLAIFLVIAGMYLAYRGLNALKSAATDDAAWDWSTLAATNLRIEERSPQWRPSGRGRR